MGKLTDHNIALLKTRIIDTNQNSDIVDIFNKLKHIKESALITGAGGSIVVCDFMRKVLEEKNNCIATVIDPRDLSYKNLNIYKNIVVVSYSGTNFGVELSLNNTLNKYLLTNGTKGYNNMQNITYKNVIQKEKSFISLAATLMPISILLNYYLNNDNFYLNIEKMFNGNKIFNLPSEKNFTVLYGDDSSTSAKFLESTFTEAGIGNVILCNKYNYCHGQTTLPYHSKNHDLIFFKSNHNDLDAVILEVTKDLYTNIIIINSNYDDIVLKQFDYLIQSIYFSYQVSQKYKKDLSEVNYSPAVKKLYYFKGSV